MIPHDDLAFQWDACQDVLAWKDYFPNRPESYKEDITGMLARIGNAVPEPGRAFPVRVAVIRCRARRGGRPLRVP